VTNYAWAADINNGDDPKLVNLAAAMWTGFRPMNGSPLIDAGIDTTAIVPGDFEGTSRAKGSAVDVGFLEFDPALKLHFDFDENFSSGRVMDVSGNGNDGWNMQGKNWITATNGPIGNAANFTVNGVMTNDPGQTYNLSTYIAVTNLAGLTNMIAGTISVWAKINPSQSNLDSIMRLMDTGANVQYYPTASNSWAFGRDYNGPADAFRVHFQVYPQQGGISNVILFPADYSVSDFHTTNMALYTVTFNCASDQIIGYYNGQPFQTNSIGCPWLTIWGCAAQKWLCIGALSHGGTPQWGDDSYPNDGFWEGQMDEIRIYNRALSPAEVGNLHLGFNAVVSAPAAQKPTPPLDIHVGP